MENKPRCRLCQSNESKFLYTKSNISIYQCSQCNFVFQYPINEKEIEDFYKKEYYGKERPVEQFINYFTKLKDHKILKVLKKYKKDGSLLDIGAGYGFFVKNAQDFGYKAEGVEPNSSSVALAKEKLGIKLIDGFFDKKFKLDKKYDIITSFHVIEHATDPSGLLDEMIKRLKKGGVLVLETPNIKSMNALRMKSKWPYIIPQEHLNYFSFKSLQAYLEKHGLKTIYKQKLGPFLHTTKMDLHSSLRVDQPRKKTVVLKMINDWLSKNLQLGDHLLIFAEKED